MFILKRLRHKKNISQSDLAQEIGVSLRTIQLYERKDANIPIKNLTKIAEYFGLSIGDLYSHEMVGEFPNTYDSQDPYPKKAHSIKKLGPGKYLVTVPLIISSGQNDYMRQYDNELFLNALPHMDLIVDQVTVAQYVAFEITNSSMDDGSKNSIPNKSVVLGKCIALNRIWAVLKDNPGISWVIVHKGGIMCKKIVSYNKREKTIICGSLNSSPEYSDFEIGMDDVLQIFVVVKKQVD